MALVFSPLTEDVLDSSPRSLLPKHAFLMRQLGGPPELDLTMTQIVAEVFAEYGISTTDASATTGGKDFLDRILGLIRSTGFTVAIFSNETRAETMANIALELGFAAMCGKPLVIVKSKQAKAPSDLTRTDWIVYDAGEEQEFRRKLGQAIGEIRRLADYEHDLLQVLFDARSMDCGVAFERANKGFLLSGEKRFIDAAEIILRRLQSVKKDDAIGDLERLRSEIGMFLRQARGVMTAA